MYYPEELIREVRERTDIVSFISGYVPLQKKGSQYFGCCPFHSEKTPSFSVNPKDQFFYCFGCHKGGNVITFLMEMDNLTFPEALKELADRNGITLPEAELSEAEKEKARQRTRLYEINREAARYFYYQLTRTEQGQRARDYLKQRQVSDEYTRKFGLGYSAIGKNSLYQHLLSKGFTLQEMEPSYSLTLGLFAQEPLQRTTATIGAFSWISYPRISATAFIVSLPPTGQKWLSRFGAFTADSANAWHPAKPHPPQLAPGMAFSTSSMRGSSTTLKRCATR